MKTHFTCLLIFCTTLCFSQSEKSLKKYEKQIKEYQLDAENKKVKEQKRDGVNLNKFQKANEIYKYPINEKNKIVYKGLSLSPSLTSELIYRRIKKFIALERFDRTEQVRCKDGSFIATQPFPNPIIFEDDELYEIVFNGFYPFQILNYRHCQLTFQGKINVREGAFSYEFTDFNVVEFKAAPKTKSKGGSMYWGYGISSSKSTSTFSDANVRNIPLEVFLLNPHYAVSSHSLFNQNREAMIQRMLALVEHN